MPNIICDTNIWYSIGRKSIDVEPVGNALCYHYLTVVELLATTNSLYSPEDHQGAIDSLFSIGRYEDSHMFPVFDHIHHLYDASYSYNENVIGNMLTNLKLLSWADLSAGIRSEYFTKGDKVRDLQEMEAIKINKYSLENKAAFRQFKQYDYTTEIREKIIMEVNQSANSNVMDMNFDWTKIELLVAAMKESSKKLTTGLTFKKNDWNDLLQLAYVQPGNLYWTKEKRWKRIITDSGMEHYLYEKL